MCESFGGVNDNLNTEVVDQWWGLELGLGLRGFVLDARGCLVLSCSITAKILQSMSGGFRRQF